MADIPIYNSSGEQVDSVFIDDKLTYINGRVSKGETYYYKGAGVPYQFHFLAPGQVTDEPILKKSSVFYMGDSIQKRCYLGKTGIFQERYQPQFSDFIGACGVKEASIYEHSLEFARSSVEYVKAIRFDAVNHQFIFKLIYHCKRKPYIENGNPKKLRELLDYMVSEGWNFPWDKTSILDITPDGLVRDVGDLYQSSDVSNAFGTVYSVLYSLGMMFPDKHQEFLRVNGLTFENHSSYVWNTKKILEANKKQLTFTSYQDIVSQHLILGKNCGDCCDLETGDKIRDSYTKKVLAMFKSNVAGINKV